jgi:hypothetical protein
MGKLQKLVPGVLMMLCMTFAAWAANLPVAGTTTLKTGTLSGQILTKGGVPLAGGMVHLFNDAAGPPPSQDKYWRVPDFMQALDSDGKFTVVLPEGKYYLGAIKRESGKTVGPPREGDLFYISADGDGTPTAYSIKSSAQVDLGRMAKAVSFKSSTVNYGKGITAMEGTVLTMDGKPVENAFVFGFISGAAVGRPLFASDPTGKDGRFILRVSDGGKFFLKARSGYGGGPPVAGEFVGDFGEKEPLAVTVNRGDRLSGLVIKVRKFGGRGPRGAVTNKAPRQLR